MKQGIGDGGQPGSLVHLKGFNNRLVILGCRQGGFVPGTTKKRGNSRRAKACSDVHPCYGIQNTIINFYIHCWQLQTKDPCRRGRSDQFKNPPPSGLCKGWLFIHPQISCNLILISCILSLHHLLLCSLPSNIHLETHTALLSCPCPSALLCFRNTEQVRHQYTLHHPHCQHPQAWPWPDYTLQPSAEPKRAVFITVNILLLLTLLLFNKIKVGLKAAFLPSLFKKRCNSSLGSGLLYSQTLVCFSTMSEFSCWRSTIMVRNYLRTFFYPIHQSGNNPDY